MRLTINSTKIQSATRISWGIEVRIIKWILVFCILLELSYSGVAWGNVDVSGVWMSCFPFGDGEEIMTANIQQIEDSILGSFSVEVKPSGDDYSGVIFGAIDGDKIRAYYLSVRDMEGRDPLLGMSFADGKLVSDDTIQGKFYYHDSDLLKLSGPYEATRC